MTRAELAEAARQELRREYRAARAAKLKLWRSGRALPEWVLKKRTRRGRAQLRR